MKKVKLNFLYNTAYQILIIITPLITAPYIARIFGATIYGNASYSNSVLNIFNLFAAYGIMTFGQKQIASYQDDKRKLNESFWNIMYLKLFLTLIVISAFTIYYLFFANPLYKSYYIMSSLVFFATLTDISWLFMGLEQFSYTFWRNFFVRFFFVIMVFVVIQEKGDVFKYISLMYLGNTLGNLALWFRALKFVGKPKRIKILKIKEYFLEATWLFLPTIAITVYLTIDQVILGYLTNKKEVGYFVQADSIVRILSTLVTSLGTVLMPRITNLFQKNKMEQIDNIVKQSYDFMLYISIPITLVMIFVGQRFVVFFYGDSFYNSGMVLIIEILTIPVVAISNVIGIQYLVPLNRTKEFSISTMFGAVANVMILPVLVLVMKSSGAALALLITELIVTGMQLYFVRNTINIWIFLKQDRSVYSGIIVMLIVLILSVTSIRIPNDFVFIAMASTVAVSTYFFTTLYLKNSTAILVINTLKGVFKK